ncbi:MAG: RHS repeat protein, partial [Methanosarcinaceae archaeon]|nr:RHS repeat protein [Methanosarcinaceae archaeon]
NPLNQLVEVTDAMGGTVQYSYDVVGNMVSMTDANGHITNYVYDPLNRPISVIDPLGYTASNTYDAVSNIVGLNDANGNVTSYTYDASNHLTKITYNDGETVSYGYDATGNRVMMTDSHGTINYQYDNLNRVVSVINPNGQTVGYMYDAVGNRIHTTYPDGKTMIYGYDANKRMASVTDWNDHITGYSYDANSNLIGMTYPNSISTEYLYDENNQLVELINKDTTQVVSSFEYTMDAVGNRLSVEELFSGRFESEPGVPQVLTTSYEYDSLYRLTQVNYPFDKTVSYNYDPMGNRISMTNTIDGIDETIDYVYDAGDRLLQSGDITYAYDNNGNTILKTENPGRVTSYGYNGENRLISLSKIFDKSQRDLYNFEYDGDGNRISKTVIRGKNTQSSDYLLDVNSILPQVLTESDKKGTNYYTYGTDLISMTDPQRGEFYYHYDGLGSVRSLSDSKESIKTIYLYDAFGQIDKELGHVDNDFLFTGEQMDDETGLIYLRARYYDPDTGRFITKDPFVGFISKTQSINRYVYTMNNPVNHIDPSGYSSEMVNSKKIKKNPLAMIIPTASAATKPKLSESTTAVSISWSLTESLWSAAEGVAQYVQVGGSSFVSGIKAAFTMKKIGDVGEKWNSREYRLQQWDEEYKSGGRFSVMLDEEAVINGYSSWEDWRNNGEINEESFGILESMRGGGYPSGGIYPKMVEQIMGWISL